ncbi:MULTISPECIES: hypothetical protein [unclassified Haladaptatus]|nr:MULTISPECIES: hypothetical protein [unclassified Haladaptatus]
MRPSLQSVLLGTNRTASYRMFWAALCSSLFLFTFAGYALGFFEVGGCLMIIPGDAALVGMAAAFGIGYSQNGLLFAWLGTFASLLGFTADHAFFGISRLSIREQLSVVFEWDGLAFFAIAGVVLGSLAFSVGILVRAGVVLLRRELAG